MSRFFQLINRILNVNQKRRTVLVAFDVACFALVDIFFFFIALRASGSVPVEKMDIFLLNSGVQLFAVFGMRQLFGVYRNVWRYSNTKAYYFLVLADALGSIAALVSIRLLNWLIPGVYYGLWQAATVGSLVALVTLMSRFVYSLLHKGPQKSKETKVRTPVVIVGAGRLGSYLVGDLRNNPNSGYEPLFFVDTDETKIGNMVSGLHVYPPERAEMLIKEFGIQDVIVTIANKDSEELSKIYFHYCELNCRVRVYDTLVSERQVARGMLREFSIEDLLFRKTISVNGSEVHDYYCGKTVLITGGGGSIGSELCRQIADCSPKKLVVFDVYENNAYDIQQELVRKYGESLNLVVEIGSVRDVARLDQLFRIHRPEIVFHAAAHKHVPLMEHSAAEAIKNNIFGTYNTANVAEKYGVEKFVLISTDKAVNPTNIMGASKRMCEMVIQCRTDSATNFAAVRFGNVLGSNGSVIPLFKRQIAEGGPVTITDKRIIRYFMTIPEASQLVIHAGAMAKKGQLFVLDMGKPVKIYDLAVNMIKLSGYEPDKDIEIREIGLRPGEKLYEELLIKTELLDKTNNKMIFIEHDTPLSREEIEERLACLRQVIAQAGDIKKTMKQMVPTYNDPGEVNEKAETSEEMRLAGCV